MTDTSSSREPQPASATDALAGRDQLQHVLTRLRAGLRYTWVGAVIVAIAAGGSLLFALKSRRSYASGAVVLYRQIIQGSDIGAERRAGTFSALGAQLQELLLTRPRLTGVIKRFNLYPGVIAKRGYDAAVDELRRDLKIRVTVANTIRVDYQAESPAIARGVVAWLTDSLIEEETRLRNEQANVTVNFIDGERKRSLEEVQVKEHELGKFLGKHPEFIVELSTSAEDGSPTAALRPGMTRRTPGQTARHDKVDARVLALERQAGRLRAELERPAGQASSVASPADERLGSMERAAEEEVREAAKLLEQRQAQFTDIHPDVKSARQRYLAARERLRRLERMRAAPVPAPPPRTDRSDLVRALGVIKRQIEARRRHTGSERESERAADDVVALELLWAKLSREVGEARNRALTLEARQFRASLVANVEQSGKASHLEVIDPAFLPSHPAGKGRTIIILLGTSAGVFLAGLVVLALAFFDGRIYGRTDLLRLKAAPLLVAVPKFKKPRTR